ncbi:hypothetical protein DENSPDRAFT_885920 [Dentipellis sp. KUC8613]|nr:hypothetical protein DENSPDRAFT_885920 [Dentipellis sp. KUC8613]
MAILRLRAAVWRTQAHACVSRAPVALTCRRTAAISLHRTHTPLFPHVARSHRPSTAVSRIQACSHMHAFVLRRSPPHSRSRPARFALSPPHVPPATTQQVRLGTNSATDSPVGPSPHAFLMPCSLIAALFALSTPHSPEARLGMPRALATAGQMVPRTRAAPSRASAAPLRCCCALCALAPAQDVRSTPVHGHFAPQRRKLLHWPFAARPHASNGAGGTPSRRSTRCIAARTPPRCAVHPSNGAGGALSFLVPPASTRHFVSWGPYSAGGTPSCRPTRCIAARTPSRCAARPSNGAGGAPPHPPPPVDSCRTGPSNGAGGTPTRRPTRHIAACAPRRCTARLSNGAARPVATPRAISPAARRVAAPLRRTAPPRPAIYTLLAPPTHSRRPVTTPCAVAAPSLRSTRLSNGEQCTPYTLSAPQTSSRRL